MYEHRSDRLLPKSAYRRRVARQGFLGLGLALFALAIGIVGYHLFEGLPWLDALLNASMILGGMGPVNELHTDAGKVFASVYALFSGAGFLVIVAVVMTPVFHRFLHMFHLEGGQSASQDQPRATQNSSRKEQKKK